MCVFLDFIFHKEKTRQGGGTAINVAMKNIDKPQMADRKHLAQKDPTITNGAKTWRWTHTKVNKF